MTATPVPAVYPEHPDDIRLDGGSVVNNYGSCQSHCCRNHGCKYGYTGCPVRTGQVVQDHPCEQCTWQIDDAARYDGTGYSTPGEVGYSVVLGFKRTADSATDGAGATASPMVGMPTDEQVAAAVKEALAGLNLNGWTVTRVLGSDSEEDD